MQRILNKEAEKFINQEITVSGWVDAIRNMGKVIFYDILDRSSKIQVVCVASEMDESYTSLDTVRPQTVVSVRGKVQKRSEKQMNHDLQTGTIEILARNIEVIAQAEPLPFDLDDSLSSDVYLDHLPLTLRTEKARAIFRMQSEIIYTFREFMRNQSFVEIQAPKLVSMATEGGANVFEVDYFGKKAYLAQSPQFYKQIMVGVFERVFTVGNVYRAEKHSTSRHINEYTSLDFELGFIKDHTDVMAIETDYFRFLVEHLQKHCLKELQLFDSALPAVPQTIPALKLREAQELLHKEFGEECLNEPDLEPHHEVQICEYIKKKYNSDFVFITHFPTDKRPFYTYPDETDPEFTKSFDLLFRGIEITTGGQRINEYEQLVESIRKWGYDPKNFTYYLEAFRYGMPPEGGLAIGLERLTAKVLGISNVKRATLFPRDLNRIDTKLSE